MEPTLILMRRWFTDTSTIGELFWRGETERECYTLEDTVRANGIKIPGRTAIPAGRYEVVVNWSNRFKQEMPLLLNVPGFDGIRIHWGNTAADTEGCLLVGKDRVLNMIGQSRAAYAILFPKIQAAVKVGKLFIELAGSR